MYLFFCSHYASEYLLHNIPESIRLCSRLSKPRWYRDHREAVGTANPWTFPDHLPFLKRREAFDEAPHNAGVRMDITCNALDTLKVHNENNVPPTKYQEENKCVTPNQSMAMTFIIKARPQILMCLANFIRRWSSLLFESNPALNASRTRSRDSRLP